MKSYSSIGKLYKQLSYICEKVYKPQNMGKIGLTSLSFAPRNEIAQKTTELIKK